MAALCSNDGSLHARGAAADDNDLLGRSGLGDQVLQLVLTAHSGVDGTCKGLCGGLGILQAVEALDAGDDLVLLTMTCLFGHFRISDGTTCHGNKVSAAGGQSLFNELGILKSAQSQHRLRNTQLLDLPGKAGILAGLMEDRGMHNGLGAGNGHIACGNVGNVNTIPCHTQELGNILGLQLLVSIGIANLVIMGNRQRFSKEPPNSSVRWLNRGLMNRLMTRPWPPWIRMESKPTATACSATLA